MMRLSRPEIGFVRLEPPPDAASALISGAEPAAEGRSCVSSRSLTISAPLRLSRSLAFPLQVTCPGPSAGRTLDRKVQRERHDAVAARTAPSPEGVGRGQNARGRRDRIAQHAGDPDRRRVTLGEASRSPKGSSGARQWYTGRYGRELWDHDGEARTPARVFTPARLGAANPLAAVERFFFNLAFTVTPPSKRYRTAIASASEGPRFDCRYCKC